MILRIESYSWASTAIAVKFFFNSHCFCFIILYKKLTHFLYRATVNEI